MTGGQGEDARSRLPNRRPQLTETIEWRGWVLELGAGFAPDGTVREVFLDGMKSGQDIEALLDDACILASMLLQHGYSAGELAAKLGREGPDSADHASVIGAVVALLVDFEQSAGDGARRQFDLVNPVTEP